MFGLPILDIFKLTVLGSIVSVLGTLLALYLKEVLAVRSFERWKSKQTLISVYRRYKLPVFLAAQELSERVYWLSRPDNNQELRNIKLDTLGSDIIRSRHALVSEHYIQYRFISNIYRLCCFLGWIELYRRDIGTLDVDTLDRNHRLEACLMNIRCALADGWINQHKDIKLWRDCLLFREELRAIGHRMVPEGGELAVIDFGEFSENLREDPTGTAKARWFVQAAHFFESLTYEKDFRIVRMRMLSIFLTDLMEVLQPGRIKRSHIQTALNWFDNLDLETGGINWQPADCDMKAVRTRLLEAENRKRSPSLLRKIMRK